MTANIASAADELHRQEYAFLRAFVTPRPEQLRSMTIGELRIENALMWERLGHTLHTGPDAPELVTTKGERKFVTICANPADLVPAGSAALRRLRDRVVALMAERGFYVSMRGFTEDAQHFAETAPVQLIDSAQLIRAMNRSRKNMALPQTYKAMCRQCGDIVQHRLSSDEARRCGNGHSVAPTIAHADVVKPRQPPGPGGKTTGPSPAPRPLSRREIRAHNYKYEARMMRKPRMR
jgi:Restriction endonuclease